MILLRYFLPYLLLFCQFLCCFDIVVLAELCMFVAHVYRETRPGPVLSGEGDRTDRRGVTSGVWCSFVLCEWYLAPLRVHNVVGACYCHCFMLLGTLIRLQRVERGWCALLFQVNCILCHLMQT